MNSTVVTCPVCEMKLLPKAAVARLEYHGQVYYFCYSSCKVLFEWDPEKYARPANQTLQEAPA
jgi:YHS domain-containing protein